MLCYTPRISEPLNMTLGLPAVSGFVKNCVRLLVAGGLPGPSPYPARPTIVGGSKITLTAAGDCARRRASFPDSRRRKLRTSKAAHKRSCITTDIDDAAICSVGNSRNQNLGGATPLSLKSAIGRWVPPRQGESSWVVIGLTHDDFVKDLRLAKHAQAGSK